MFHVCSFGGLYSLTFNIHGSFMNANEDVSTARTIGFNVIFLSPGDSTVINIEADVHGTMTSVPATAGSVIIDIPDVIPTQSDTSDKQSAKNDADKIDKLDHISISGALGDTTGDAIVAVVPKSTAAPSVGHPVVKVHTLSASAQVNIGN